MYIMKVDPNFTSQQFKINGLATPFRLERHKNGGGIMLYIRNYMTSKQISSEPCLEGIFIELSLGSKRWLLYAGYNYQKSNITNSSQRPQN